MLGIFTKSYNSSPMAYWI